MKKKEFRLFVQAMMVLSLLPISTIYGEEPDTDDNKKVKFSVLKTNESGENIKGAYLRVFDESNNLVEEWTTEEGRKHDVETEPGIYILHEESAPEGYLTAADIKFTVDENGYITSKTGDCDGNTLTMIDYKSTIQVQVVNKTAHDDVAEGTLLDGVSVVVTTKDGAEYKNWTTGTEAVSMDIGKDTVYTFTVSSLPQGYRDPGEVTLTVNADGSIDDIGGILSIECEYAPAPTPTPTPTPSPTPEPTPTPTATPSVELPVIKSGADQTWTKGGSGLIITSTTDYAAFKCVKVDGNVLDAKYYDVKAGSTVVTLHADYLETLSVGKHTLSIVDTNDKEAVTAFNIATTVVKHSSNTSGSNSFKLVNTGVQ